MKPSSHAASPPHGASPGSFAAWILASRPATLTAAVAPVAVGCAVALAIDAWRLGTSIAALLTAIWIQIGTNFANDVFDYEKGADTGERLGPTRAVQAGLLTAAQMRRGMFLAFAFAFACGLYLCWVAGWELLVIGIVSILSGIAYTGGPFPLAYNGLGDIFVFFFFGCVAVCATAYVNIGTVPELAWWASIPVGALATAILVVNNLRDRKTDAVAGKRTLAVRFGRRGAVGEYVFLLMLAYLAPPVMWLRGVGGVWLLLPLSTLPIAVILLRQVLHDEGRALNATLAGTARLLLLFSLLLAVGLILGVPAQAY